VLTKQHDELYFTHFSELMYFDVLDVANPFRYLAMTFSTISLCICTPLMYVWKNYEFNCHNRTLINRYKIIYMYKHPACLPSTAFNIKTSLVCLQNFTTLQQIKHHVSQYIHLITKLIIYIGHLIASSMPISHIKHQYFFTDV
jgi:hypothetical protein